ncbi:MAG TPA: ATPase, T2SS/T4P/T4SS family [Planctomycetota bacterium]|nr:ATPase, T2SS/T4P/T4SS family [Planctomycetota bacterium]
MKSASPLPNRSSLGDLLVEKGLIQPADLENAMTYKQERNVRLGQALIALKLVTEADLAAAMRDQGKIPCIHLTIGMVDREVAQALGEERSRKHQAVAVNRIAGVTTVAVEDPTDLYGVDAISLFLKSPVLAVHAEPATIERCLEEIFRKETGGPKVDEILTQNAHPLGEGVNLDVLALEEEDDESKATDIDQPVINMVRALLEEAFVAGASDVHLEPTRKALRVRFRVDGALYERVSLPKAWARPVLARLKVIANLDIAERRLPQDGRVQAEIRGHRVDLRIATTPTLAGEGGVVRILDGGRKLLDLESLGLEPKELESMRRMVEGGDGVVLATGPTGHGKTTTLYALLQHVHAPDTKIITIEDPVENSMDGITQITANSKIGLTFARGLRSILRQDPDVVLIGEVRDQETAQIAVQAALTGHLVLSTLHTVGAAESVTRLADMGIEPFLLADTLRGIIAQRLIRKICQRCKRIQRPRAELLERLGIAPEDDAFFGGAGCDVCAKTGYKGRIGIYEIMTLDADLCTVVRRNGGAGELRDAARAKGMMTLREDGIRKARAGMTTLEEVYAATARG